MNQQPQQEQQIHLQDYLQILLKRKWTLITFFIIVVTVVTIGTFRMSPIYRATATLLIEKEYTTMPYREGISFDVSQQDYYQSQYKIMKSRALAKKAIDELQLEKTPEFSNSKDIVSSFLNCIIVEPERNTRLVKLSAELPSPKLATQIANTLAKSYVDQNLEYRLFASREILKKLPQGISVEDLSGKEESISSLPSVVQNSLIQELKANYVKLESEYAELSKRYKDKHPRMIGLKAALEELNKKINQETKNIVESIKIELSGNLKTNNIRIIDPAEVPSQPIKPKKQLNILLAVIVGLLGGAGLAFFFDYMDNTIKNEQDIEQYLELALLGFVPKIKIKEKKDQAKKNMFVITEPKSVAAESIKSIRSNITFSLPKEKLKNILITSAGPEEGKTLIATNLAITFAQMEEETLLVDCDLRRSSLHRIFRLHNDRGMTNYLIGETDIDSIIQKTEIEHLSIVTAGTHPPNPAELLNPAKLNDFIGQLKNKFSKIIFDSPPILPVSDPINLASVTDGIILVVKYGQLNRYLVNRVKQMLLDTNAKIIGVILNNIDIETRGHYYYPYYYYRHYRYDEK